jgi:hypothetical protein
MDKKQHMYSERLEALKRLFSTRRRRVTYRVGLAHHDPVHICLGLSVSNQKQAQRYWSLLSPCLFHVQVECNGGILDSKYLLIHEYLLMFLMNRVFRF